MVAAIGAVAAVGSAAMSANAAGKASDQQSQSTAQSNALQRYMYDNNVALQAPTINTGNAARDRLSYLLGLSPTGYSGSGAGGSSTPLTYDSLRQQLLSQYTKNVTNDGKPYYANAQEAIDALGPQGAYQWMQEQKANGGFAAQTGRYEAGSGPNTDWTFVPDGPKTSSQIDQAGLDAEINRRLAEQEAQRQAAIEAAKNDPNYGRLAQQFEFDKYTPDKFSYTGQDLYNDPSYQFRLEQGQKAIDRQGAASGRFLSGAQLQASSDYNQGAASQEFQNAYQRALGTFSTNEGNRYNAFTTNEGNRFNAYQANFNNAVNPLLALSGAATLGSQNLGSAGASMANQVGNNLTNQANASGAAGIASANQISGGLNGAVNSYQQNQLMNSLLNRGSVNNNPSGGTDTLFGSSGFYSGNRGSGD